ncbi:ABC transporter ATP-binding protein [uncultured Paracoccus sp.]|uniref:ABC transporter ATP-binding protein n=1 Tax=uncultured Paracoccus sp. TaxID=189685 RepID=UPI0025D374A3|nr:ABC transporter ATP-binding protein [uncultured Paracoccus sp.]
MLEIEELAVTRGRAGILASVNARLAPGQIVGLVGPNGTGKSTLLNAIAGLQPCRGRVRWKGAPVVLERIGYMPQNARVAANLTVIETVLLGRYEGLGWKVDTTALDRALGVLEELGIAHLHVRSMATLSGGQQQLVLLAQRLLREPDLLLLDEATSALDIRHQMQVFQRLRAYVERSGALVVVAVHDLNLAGRHCERLCLLHGGRIHAEGPFGSVVTPPALAEVYGIEAEFLTTASGHPVILPIGPCGASDYAAFDAPRKGAVRHA